MLVIPNMTIIEAREAPTLVYFTVVAFHSDINLCRLWATTFVRTRQKASKEVIFCEKLVSD
jgi:hypothetical protein